MSNTPEGATSAPVEVAYTYEARPMTPGEKAFLAGLAVTVIGGFGWLFRATIKEEKKAAAENKERIEAMRRKRAEREAWFDEQRKNGKMVIETREGTYMAIDNDAYMKAEFRKKAL